MTDLITIVGSGQMATVAALILAEQGISVRLWAASRERADELRTARENRRYLPGFKFPDRVSITDDASAAFGGAGLIISAIPCQNLRGVWQKLAGSVAPGQPVASVTKGIEIETLARPTQIITDVAGARPMCVLSGPNIAAELAQRLPATMVAASDDAALAERVQRDLSTQWLRVYTNTDVVGVELAGALKNVIALAAGIIDGLRAGDNAKAALVTRGLVEITRLGTAMGARRETFAGLAGLGDLVTTCVSPAGRNRTAGEAIGRGRAVRDVIASMPSVIEGIPTTRSAVLLARQHDVAMPITEAVYSVLFEGQDVIKALGTLMSRGLRGED